MKRHGYFTYLRLTLACLGFLCSAAMAQTPISNLIVSVGTTVQDTAGHNWSCLMLGSPEYQLLFGKQFGIYAKNGYPTNAGAFSQRGVIFQQTNAAAINTLLNEAVALGENLSLLSEAYDNLLQSIPGITNDPLPQKVLLGFQTGATNADVAQTVGLLAHLHPGLILCLGQGFAEQITNVTTYEIREMNPANGLAAEVVGRVTIVPGSPVILPAPGQPFQVVTNDPSDNYRIRLRWGTSDAFRRVSLLSFGFDVWRISAAAAVSSGYVNTPPTPMQLQTDPNFKQVNLAPVIATKDFSTDTGAGGASDPTDQTTYFFSDKNGYTGITNSVVNSNGITIPVTPPSFGDGEQFYYFVAARDVLGREGLVSQGVLATSCRRWPPVAPTGVEVQNTFKVIGSGASAVNEQYLTVGWQQDNNTNDQVTEYWVYRWPNPAMVLTNDEAPTDYRVGVVPQLSGSLTNFFADTNAGAPMTPGTTNFWYTVRAVSQAACGPLLSPNSMPAWGVLRQRIGPGAATGQVLGSCGSPTVIFQNFLNITNGTTAISFSGDYSFACERADPGIAWAEFFITNAVGPVETLGPVYFASDNDLLQLNYSLVGGTNEVIGVACVVGTEYGEVSAPTSVVISNWPQTGVQLETVFLAGQVMLTSLTSTNSLLQAIGGASPCFPAIDATAYPSGTVRMRFDYVGSSPLLIQANTGTWIDAGIATRDPNGYYSISYPACLLGPLPSFQGCVINLPAESDCSQSITRGAGSGPVNKIQLTFTLTPGSAEFRLYRSVNNGTLTMIAQGKGAYNPNDPNATVVCNDDGMPPSAATLCYYVQLLDEHGNAGPMSFLGCKDVKPPALPRPVQSEPQVAGSAANPQVVVNWFCPTSGVYRFEVLVQRADHPGGSVPLSFSASDLTPLSSYNTKATYQGLLSNPNAVSQFDAALLTTPEGPNFGPGPKFQLTANILTNVPYNISVAAVDDQGHAGTPSKVWQFVWKATNSFSAVPWPSLPLPTVNAFDDEPPAGSAIQPRVAAVALFDTNSVFDGNYPVGIRIGDLSPVAPITENIGTTNFFTYQVAAPSRISFGQNSPYINPNSMIFQRLSKNSQRRGESLLPIVVYRQQVTNASFPRVSGTITQVTPLIEQMAYGSVLVSNSYYNVTIYDRLIAGGPETATNGTGQFLYVRDQQPVIVGASYQYFVVRMSTQREIAEIIPAGTVTIP